MDKHDFRFLVHVEDSTDTFSKTLLVRLHIVRIEDGHVRNPLEDEWSGFAITAQMDSHAWERGQGWYGWRAECRDLYAVNLPHAEAIVKTLRKVERNLVKLEAKWGQPTDFAMYASRVADAFGTQPHGNAFGRTVTNGRGMYDDNEHRWMTVDGLRMHLDRQVQEWAEKHSMVREGQAS